MSKKKFTDGLESIFTTPYGTEGGSGTAFLEGGGHPAGANQGDRHDPRRSASRKDFTTDLDSLLESAMQETFEERMQQKGQSAKPGDTKGMPPAKSPQVFHQQTHRRRPGGGLDVLIRRTVEMGAVEEDASGTKRLTVSFDKEKLNKLKIIARLEKAYLKDILGEIIDEYISRYEEQQRNNLG